MIIIKLFSLQVINGNKYYDKMSAITVKNNGLSGERGIIFDSNGKKLAFNEKVYDVLLYKRKKTINELNADLLKIYEILEHNNERVLTDLPLYMTNSPVAYGIRIGTTDEVEIWLKDMVIRKNDINKLKTPKDVFEYFREEKFYISDTYSDEEAYKIMCLRYEMLIKGYYELTPLKIAENIKLETIAELEINRPELEGVFTAERYIRKYIDSKAFAAVTGYIRAIEPKEVKEFTDKGYSLDELVGKEGIEKSYEKYLRALPGIETAILEPGEIELAYNTSIYPISGFDLVTTIDAGVQQRAYDSLARNIEKIASEKDGIINFGDAKNGAAVMIDVMSGDVISLVSYPGYDANAFIRNDEKEIEALTNDPDKLQLNRAIQGLYPPGSAFKPLTALTALESGAYTPGELVTDDGVINYDGMDFYSMEYKKYGRTYGDIDLKYALQVSANVFFYKIGVATGIDALEDWAKRFGLGEKTGIDIAGEAQGRRNSKDTMKLIEPDRNWGRADTAQTSIGQLYNQFTPIQITRYIAAIANGGKLFIPRIVKSIYKRDGSTVAEFDPEVIDTEADITFLSEVQKGMLAVANETDGSAVDVFKDFPYGVVAAKTGTPETGMEAQGGSSHSIFVCYAPFDDPEVAVCVVIENGVWGANSAPVAYDMLMEYFKEKEDK